jgi:periplasmic divalent cation tolerance protein
MSGENVGSTVSGTTGGADHGSAPTPHKDGVVLIYTTFPSQSEAEIAGHHLVENKLAACVNIFPGMIAIFSWEGKTDRAAETAVLVKTAASRADDALEAIKRLHPYSVPARLVIPVAGGGADFLAWIVAQTASVASQTLCGRSS